MQIRLRLYSIEFNKIPSTNIKLHHFIFGLRQSPYFLKLAVQLPFVTLREDHTDERGQTVYKGGFASSALQHGANATL